MKKLSESPVYRHSQTRFNQFRFLSDSNNTLHSLAERCLGPLWRKPLYRFLYKNYVNAITISELCRESFEKLYSIKKPLMIYNGRSPIEETEKCNEVRKEINSLKLHPDDKVFIHVARFHPVKNHTLLFHTFKKLIDEGEHIILLIIGNGYDGHIFFKKNNSKGVYLLGEKRNVGDYLCCSDCFVMSSLKEGLPISLIEAMSMGIIPVSTPAGGVCDVIRNHENGYLSPTHTFEDFYKTVKESIINVAGIMPEKLINEYLEKYSMNRCSCDYLNAYRVEYVKRKRRPKS